MARRMMNLEATQQKERSQVELSLDLRQKTSSKSKAKLSQMEIDRVLARKRSKEYMEAITRLDAGGHMHNQHKVNAIIEIIRQEMPEIEIDMGPLGIVSKCYLGAPYEVHTLDIAGQIIEHYETFRSMPGMLEKARSLAKSSSYEFIEVYAHALRAVKSDGTVATLKE